MFKMFFEYMVKGIMMTIVMKNGEIINGQYELLTVDNDKVCLFTDRKDEYEYFKLDDIKSVLIENRG